jgi:hypothetical protein
MRFQIFGVATLGLLLLTSAQASAQAAPLADLQKGLLALVGKQPQVPMPIGGIPLKAMNHGQLTHSDSLDKIRIGSSAKTYYGVLQGGVTYTFDLTSNQFDTFLYITNSSGVLLLLNDDFQPGNITKSRVVFTPPKTAQYNVIVTTYLAGQTGNFVLQYSTGGAPSTGGGGLKTEVINGTLTKTDPAIGGRNYDLVTRTLKAGVTVTISLTSNQFDTLVYVKTSNGVVVAANDDFGGSLNAQVSFVPESTAPYQIYVTSYAAGQFGNYTLSIKQ